MFPDSTAPEELVILGAITTALDQLDAGAKKRCVDWLAERYTPAPPFDFREMFNAIRESRR